VVLHLEAQLVVDRLLGVIEGDFLPKVENLQRGLKLKTEKDRSSPQ
jgi:hypothetical protein